MTVPLNITVRRRGAGFSAKEWRDRVKAAFDFAAKLWHRIILRKHFTMQAYFEYGYQDRSYAYNKRKQKKYGHSQPLVFTGTLKREVSRVQDIRATSKGATIVLHGPRYLYQFRRNLNQPDKAKELRTISARDEKALVNAIDRHLQKDIDRAERAAGFTDVRVA